jgi:uncharacterized membrane protein
MSFNIHPLVVHFPIALLVVYSVITLLPLRRWLPQIAWKQITTTLLLIGVVSAFAASSTGEVAEHLVRPDRDLVEMHAFFAGASTWIYGLLLLGELLALFGARVATYIGQPIVTRALRFAERILQHRVINTMLVLLGLVAITLTGLLGGVMVYGTTADPLAPIVLRLLGL